MEYYFIEIENFIMKKQILEYPENIQDKVIYLLQDGKRLRPILCIIFSGLENTTNINNTQELYQNKSNNKSNNNLEKNISDDENKIMINGSITIQIPVNILDQRICSSIINSDKVSNIPNVQARSIFLRGLLSNLDNSQSVVGEKDLTDLKLFHKWCNTSEVNPTFACINFVYHLNTIDTIILGVNSKIELINNLRAVDESKEHKLKVDFRDFKSLNLNLIDPRRWAV